MTNKILFVGGQYHGHVLPVCDASVRDATSEVDPILRADPAEPPYAGYRLCRLGLESGGVRLLAVHRNAALTAERSKQHITDAMSLALDNYERVLKAIAGPKRRRVPLNFAPDDEPGVPAKRRPTRADLERD